jgi:hypothetical protein
MKFLFRALVPTAFVGFGLFSAELSKRSVQLWAVTDRNDDLISFATWQTLSWVFVVLAVVMLIWAVVSTRND